MEVIMATVEPTPVVAEQKDMEPKTIAVSARKRAEELMDHTRDGKLVAQIFGDALDKQYTIHGRSMRDWRNQFKLNIPENPDPAQCKMLAAKLATHFHEATFYYSLAEAQLDALASGEFKEYTQTFEIMVAEHKKKYPNKSLPAQKTLETLAHGQMLDLKGAMNNARITKQFWKRILEGLTEVRKNLELITRNNYMQLQLEPRGNIPDYVPNRGVHGKSTE